MSDTPERDSLPFERKSKKKKVEKKPAPTKITSQSSTSKKHSVAGDSGVPEAVSKRMVTRMALFSGIPTALGMLSFVAFYFVVSRDLLDIPTYVVFAASLLFFGIGVLGLSYGIFSSSWQEEEPGTLVGWSEFRLNLGRTINAWRMERQAAQAAKKN